MSKQITYHFGENRAKGFPEFNIGNTLVCGGTHTTWWTVIRNLLSEQIVQHDKTEILLRIFDSKSTDLALGRDTEGIGSCDICEVCVGEAEENISSFLHDVHEEVSRRDKLIFQADKSTYVQYNRMTPDQEVSQLPATIVVLHNFGYTLDRLGDEQLSAVRDHVRFIMSRAETTGVYLLITCQADPKFVLEPLDIWPNSFSIVALTSMGTEQSTYALGNDIAMYMSDEHVAVRDVNGDIRVLKVPNYYNPETIEAIQQREFLPKGISFEEDRLHQWGLFVGDGSEVKQVVEEEVS